MIYYLTIGIILGLSAGLAPGPLLALVISETLEHDIKAGIKIALAPVITDLPIILGSFFVFSKLTDFHFILGLISLIGGCFVFYMGYKNLRSKGITLNLEKSKPNSLMKGILANALSPHPYLFWFSVGAPLLTKALGSNKLFPLLFIGAFYTFLVGSKITLAILVGKSKHWLRGDMYLYTMRSLGLVLCAFSILLFIDGLELLGMMGA